MSGPRLQETILPRDHLSRRSFLNTVARWGGALPFATSLKALEPGGELGAMRKQIADQVSPLRKREGSSLKLLYPDGCLSNLKPVCDAFEQDTGVSVNLSAVSVDMINTHILLGVAGSDQEFDVAIPATFGIPDLVEAGALADLTSLRETYEPAHFDKGMLYTLGDNYKGRFYGYQTDGDTYLMFYRKDLLEDADASKRFADAYGYELGVPDTWEALDATMAFFHQPSRDQYGGCLFRNTDYSVWEWWMRLHAKGSYPVDETMTAIFQKDAGHQALEAMIRASEHQHPSAISNGLFDNWKVYSEGQCFANIGWGGSQKYLNRSQSKVRGKLAYALAPGGKRGSECVRMPYFNWGWNYVVSRASEQKELAYLFTLYASCPEISTLAVCGEEGFFDPYREGHYENPKIESVYSASFLKAHRESMAASIPDFYVSGHGEYFSVLKEYFLLAFQRELSVEKALLLASKEWELITERLGRQSQINQWGRLRKSYPQAVQAYIGSS